MGMKQITVEVSDEEYEFLNRLSELAADGYLPELKIQKGDRFWPVVQDQLVFTGLVAIFFEDSWRKAVVRLSTAGWFIMKVDEKVEQRYRNQSL